MIVNVFSKELYIPNIYPDPFAADYIIVYVQYHHKFDYKPEKYRIVST